MPGPPIHGFVPIPAPGHPQSSTLPYPAHPGASVAAGKPRTRALAVVTIIVLSLLIVAAAGGGALLLAPKFNATPSLGRFVDQKAIDRQIGSLITARAKAVQDQNRAAFLASVDRRDTGFYQREEAEYDNLIKLHLSTFELVPLRGGIEDLVLRNSPIWAAFPNGIRGFKVTVKYAIRGIDTEPVAAPWLPIFGQVDGRWMLGGEFVLSEKADAGRLVTAVRLPSGSGGQAWQGGPIAVIEGTHATVVVSQNDAAIGDDLLKLADRAAEQVVTKRSKGWSGHVLVTALSGGDVYRSYFVFDHNGPDAFAALAIPYYNEVPEFTNGSEPAYAGSRVVFNPDQLDEDHTWLSVVLTHEFTHVAMGPYTGPATPLWLVEGIAEYVGYSAVDVNWDVVADKVIEQNITSMPADNGFYNTPENYYAGWLLCRMISNHYGEAKLFDLYEYFHTSGNQPTRAAWDAATQTVLGVSFDKLEIDYKAFIKNPS